MMKEDIPDTEIRVIDAPDPWRRKHRWWIWAAGLACAVIVAVCVCLFGRTPPEAETEAAKPLAEWMAMLDTVTTTCAATADVQNGVHGVISYTLLRIWYILGG